MPDRPGVKIRLAVCLFLVLAVAVIYGRTLGFGFITLDDNIYVYHNPDLETGLSLEGIKTAFQSSRGSLWMPVTRLSFRLDYELYGLWPGGYHLTNLIFHAANAVLLFLLATRWTGRPWPAALAAALLAVHPLHVESVAWIAERKDVLSLFFLLAALGAHTWWAEKGRWYFFVSALAAYALSLMAKPMMVTLPALLLLLDAWPLHRTALGWPKLIAEKIPYAVLAGAVAVTALGAAGSADVTQSVDLLPVSARLANALVSYGAYLAKMVWPVSLGVLYPHPGTGVSPLHAAGTGLLLIFLLAVSLAYRRTRPQLAVGLLWFLMALFPVIGLVQAGPQAMADRFAYVPLIGIYLALAYGLADWAAEGRRRQAAVAVGTAVVLVLGGLAWRQAGYWRDDLTLFEHALAVTENNPLMHNNVGRVYADQGRLKKAWGHFLLAEKSEPASALTQYNLGTVRLKTGRYREAEKRFRRSLALDPNFVSARVNLGAALMRLGRPAEAVEQFRAAADLGPDDPQNWCNLAQTLLALGRAAEAASAYERALALKPDYPLAARGLEKARRMMENTD